MSELTFSTVAPFQVVRPVLLSDVKKERAVSILRELTIEKVLGGKNHDDWHQLTQLNRQLEDLGDHENRVKYCMHTQDMWLSANYPAFMGQEELREFVDVENWVSITNIGHPVDMSQSLVGEMPYIRISVTLFTDGHGRRCDAEAIFIPRKMFAMKLLRIPEEYDYPDNEFLDHLSDNGTGYSTFGTMPQIEVFENALSGKLFSHVYWPGEELLCRGEFKDEQYSAIFDPDIVLGENNYVIEEI